MTESTRYISDEQRAEVWRAGVRADAVAAKDAEIDRLNGLVASLCETLRKSGDEIARLGTLVQSLCQGLPKAAVAAHVKGGES